MLKDRFTKNKTYKNKLIQTEACDYNENIQFNDKGVMKINHKALKALRDFMIHDLELNVIEQKVSIFIFLSEVILFLFCIIIITKFKLADI